MEVEGATQNGSSPETETANIAGLTQVDADVVSVVPASEEPTSSSSSSSSAEAEAEAEAEAPLGAQPGGAETAPSDPPIEAVPVPPKPISFNAVEKIQHICNEVVAVNAALSRASTTITKHYTVDSDACKLVASYARELTGAILEEALLLARHRGSNEVCEQDLLLVMAKKFNIEVPGHPRIVTHSHVLKATPTSRQPLSIVPQLPTATTSGNTGAASVPSVVSQHFKTPHQSATSRLHSSSSSLGTGTAGVGKEDSKKRKRPAPTIGAEQSNQSNVNAVVLDAGITDASVTI